MITTNPISARGLAKANLKRRAELEAVVGGTAFHWGRNILRVSRFPGFMSDVFLYGYENLKGPWQKYPVVAFSHKKLHDVFTFVYFIVARPLPTFFLPHTIVAQGGLYSGMYPYRDWIPGFVKHSFLKHLGIAVARRFGKWMQRQLNNMNIHPLFRRFRDVPSERQYESATFAGPAIMGMAYPEFTAYTREATHQSMRQVFTDLDKGLSLYMFPEGKYQHDGSVAALNRLIEEVVSASPRPVVLNSVSYDELCPDRLGRIDGFINSQVFHAETLKPGDLFRGTLQARLQAGTVVTASHLIATAVLGLHKNHTSFTPEALSLTVMKLQAQVRDAGYPADVRLADTAFTAERVRRFLKSGKGRYVARSGKEKGHYKLSGNAFRRFAASERTTNDLLWNQCNIAHLSGLLGFG